jgi:hypothetical protein
VDVSQSDITQRGELLPNARLILKHGTRLFHGEIEDFGDAASPEVHFEGFTIKALPFADITRNKDIRQEVHFNFDQPIALTALTPSSLHVEREAARSVPSDFGFGELGKQLSHRCKDARIRGRI